MSDFSIRARGLSKRFQIGAVQERYPTLRSGLMEWALHPVRSTRSTFRPKASRFWALLGVSFDIARGEVVGVIGSNGAGKSTLLKILSRITEPTSGYAEISGRVASLLEVGTGFHQELTGRENILLNGAILGMKRAEIARRFDDIVDFAEVSDFIDTPIKHYSTGMHLRLAFAVAAHLEPEVLLVDEVLAVGDMAFQKKCLGRLETVAASGRTVLFVSHNLGIVKDLCETCIVLEHGEVSFRGPVVQGIAHYSRTLAKPPSEISSRGTRWGSVSIDGQPNPSGAAIQTGRAFALEAPLHVADAFTGGFVICLMSDPAGVQVVHKRLALKDLAAHLVPGMYRVRVECPPLWLAPGVYTAHFKFLGSQGSGREERHESERAVIDVLGDSDGISKANLAPAVSWSLRRETVGASVPLALS